MKAILLDAKKAGVALVGLVAIAATSGLLTGTAKAACEAVLAVATTLGVYKAENVKK